MDVILLLLCYFILFFFVGTLIKNNSIVDIGWGIGFVLVAWFVYLRDPELQTGQFIMTLLITLWGLRLFYHILKRNIGKPEDFRYAAWRKEWGKWLIPRAFLQVYMLQGFLMYLVSLPIIFVQKQSGITNTPFLVFGSLVWLIGFCFEAIGDSQLKVFLFNPDNSGKLMTSGLWQYTRHPNYFGEATMWWGIFLIALSTGANIFSILSPIIITFLLVFVSGIPMLEKSMRKKPGFSDYARKTSIFIPWFPKK